MLLIIITDKQKERSAEWSGQRVSRQCRQDLSPGSLTPQPVFSVSTWAASLPICKPAVNTVMLPKSLHKTPCMKCLLQFGGRKSFVSYKKLVCFPFLKIRVMQLIMCSFCLGCQEAQSQIVGSITATDFLLPIFLFLIFPFDSFFTNIFICVSC